MYAHKPQPEPVPASDEIAYSYIRFSHPSQSEGDSLRRQTEATAEWCERNKIRLDTSLTLRDLGVSAFRGRHRTDDKNALAQFLKLVERGRIPKGSYLIIENLDRLSREDERPALRLWMDILDAGINIVQLYPETVFRHEKSDMVDIMRAIIELSRGHSESAIKSERVGAAWHNRRNEARAGNLLLTRQLPAWVEVRGDKIHLIPERAAVVKRIYTMCAEGRGIYSIMKKLQEEGVPAFGPSGRWSINYLHLILSDRRAVGEMQPRLQGKGRGKPDGEPIPDYFPRVVDDTLWERARLGLQQRWRKPGKVTADVNVFAGLLRGALDGEAYVVGKESGKGKPYRIIRSNGPRKGLGKFGSFPLLPFERAVFSFLSRREIDPHEILNGDSEPDESEMLSRQLERKRAKREEIEAELLQDESDSPALARLVRKLEQEEKELGEKLALAAQKAASPLSETWGEAQTLLETIDTAPDREAARLRLRAALRRIVDSIWLLVVPRGRDRLCYVQIWFNAGKHHRRRDYLIFFRPSKANASARVPGFVKAESRPDMTAPLDLRKRADARKLESYLASEDLETLIAPMRDLPTLHADTEK